MNIQEFFEQLDRLFQEKRIEDAGRWIVQSRQEAEAEEDLQSLADETPRGRLGTVQDVADMVDFILSEKASFITGQIITVDGGFAL